MHKLLFKSCCSIKLILIASCGLSSFSMKLQNDNSEEFSELHIPSSSDPVKSFSNFLVCTFGAPKDVFRLNVDISLIE